MPHTAVAPPAPTFPRATVAVVLHSIMCSVLYRAHLGIRAVSDDVAVGMDVCDIFASTNDSVKMLQHSLERSTIILLPLVERVIARVISTRIRYGFVRSVLEPTAETFDRNIALQDHLVFVRRWDVHPLHICVQAVFGVRRPTNPAFAVERPERAKLFVIQTTGTRRSRTLLFLTATERDKKGIVVLLGVSILQSIRDLLAFSQNEGGRYSGENARLFNPSGTKNISCGGPQRQ